MPIVIESRTSLPRDVARATLAGRAWVPGAVAGPSPVLVTENSVLDVSRRFATLAELMIERNPAEAIKRAAQDAPAIGPVDTVLRNSAADARKLQLGQLARIGGFEKDSATEASADPEGKVVYIADQAEVETGSFAVKVRFPNRDLKLRANAVARVRILTKPRNSCSSTSASSFTPRRSTVWFMTGMPWSTSMPTARRDSCVSSRGWLKCVITQIGW